MKKILIFCSAIIAAVTLSGCTNIPVSEIKKTEGAPILSSFVNSAALGRASDAKIGDTIAIIKIANVFHSITAESNSACIFRSSSFFLNTPALYNTIPRGIIPVSFTGRDKKTGETVYYLLGRTFINPVSNAIDHEYVPFDASGHFLGYVADDEGVETGFDYYSIPKTCHVTFNKSGSFERVNSIWAVGFMGYGPSGVKLGVYSIDPSLQTKTFAFADYVPELKGTSVIRIPVIGKGYYALLSLKILSFGDGFIKYEVLPFAPIAPA